MRWTMFECKYCGYYAKNFRVKFIPLIRCSRKIIISKYAQGHFAHYSQLLLTTFGFYAQMFILRDNEAFFPK